jgi:hypothetical protein
MAGSLTLYRPAIEAVEEALEDVRWVPRRGLFRKPLKFQEAIDRAAQEHAALLRDYRALSLWEIGALFRGAALNANIPHWYDAAVTAVCTLLNTGKMEILSGAQPAADAALTGTLLATLTFGATAFGASSGGVATANAITAGTAAATNTAGYHALLESNGTTVVATGSVGTSGADLNFNSLSISAGASVSCSAYTVTGG